MRVAASFEARGQTQPAAILDLSLGGALVVVRVGELRTGDRVRLTFRVLEYEQVDCEATIRWLTPDAVGVQFDGLRAREVWALTKFFSQSEAL